MRSFIYCLCLFIGLSVASLSPYWRLTWSDEFNTLDTTKWNLRDMSGNYGNSELQWYSPNQTSVATDGSLNVLKITGIKKSWGGEKYVSSWLDTQDKAMFTYGRYEIKAKMAAGKGTWPALWLLSQNKCWASGAEVDIAEFIGKSPSNMGQYYHYATKCCPLYTSSCISSQGKQVTTSSDLTSGYHIYAFEWFPENMTWYIDSTQTVTFKTNVLTVQDATPHYWIINLAIGGGYPGNPDSTTVFPLYQYVDYVRNYVWRVSCTGEKCSGHGTCNTNTMLCECVPGWVGATCEQDVRTYYNNFTEIINLNRIPNGWGFAGSPTIFNQNNALFVTDQVGSTTLNVFKLTLSSAGCPGSCYGGTYSSGAWESIPRFGYGTFTFTVKSTNVPGTSLSLSAAGEQAPLEQVAFSFVGDTPNQVQLIVWQGGGYFPQTVVNLGFDASAAYHKYSYTFYPKYVLWFVDSVLVFNSSYSALNAVRLAPGAYYFTNPGFSYSAPSSVYLDQLYWQMLSQ